MSQSNLIDKKMKNMKLYPIRHHTRLNSAEYLDHIIDIFEGLTPSSDNIWRALQYEQISTLMDFMGMTTDDLVNLEYTKDEKQCTLTKAEKRLVRDMHAWVIWESKHCPGIDYESLTLDDYDQFLLERKEQSC